jgi:hypothetical protein
MTRDDALTIVGMVVAGWPGGEWDSDQMESYARAIMDMDAEAATKAVLVAQKSEKFRPSVATLREYVAVEARKLEPEKPKPTLPVGPRVIPDWAKIWIVARFVHADYRVLREQMPELQPNEIPDLMPDDVRAKYADEASHLPEQNFWKMMGQVGVTG